MSPIVAWRVLLIGVGTSLCLTTNPGCAVVPDKSGADPQSADTVVVSRRQDPYTQTVVRVYSLRGIGLKDALPDEIQAFMETMRQMVVAKSWDRTASSVQVFGMLMTVRTTAENHLLIEHYLSEVRRVMEQQPLTMAPPVR